MRTQTSFQVRGLDVCDLGILTSSRDKTAKIWAEDGTGCYSVLHTLVRRAWRRVANKSLVVGARHLVASRTRSKRSPCSLAPC